MHFPKLYISIFCLLLIDAANAQKFSFEQLTTAEGLPSDYVNQVYEDRSGFLWIATDKGACRYDGRTFQLFNKDNGLPDNFVICFAEDSRGQIWIGTYAGGICKFDGKEIISTPFRKNGFPRAISQIHFNSNNSFLVVTRESDLYYFSDESSTPAILPYKINYIAPIAENKFLAANKSGDYVLTRTNENYSLEKQNEWNSEDELIKPWVSTKDFLLNKKDGLVLLQVRENRLCLKKDLHIRLRLPTIEIKDYDIDNEKILIGTTQGLIYIDQQGQEFFFGAANGLGSDYINNIGRDRRGNVYICTFGAGIKLWKEPYLKSVDLNGKITSIFPDGQKLYLTSTQQNYEYNLTDHKLTAYYKLDRGNFTSIYRAPDGSIFVGSLVDFYRLPNEFAWRNLNERNKSSYLHFANQGTSGFSFKHKRMYASTYGDGIMILDPDGRPTDTIEFGSGIVEALVPLSNSIAALTFSTGVVLIDSLDRLQRISKDEGLLSNTVHAIFEEREDLLWIGTFSGLNRFEGNGKVKTFSFKEGFIGNRAVCIFGDKMKRLFVLSDKYLHILEGDQLRAIRSHPVLINPKDAINRAVYDPNSDQLFIGLTNALLMVDMGKIKPDTVVSGPALFDVELDTNSVNLIQEKLVISSKNKKISFRFVDPLKQFNSHSDILYKLEPFDEDWKLLDNSMEALYQKIPSGNYRLMARTVNADGYSSPVVDLLKFEVLPPLWKQTWFLILITFVLLAVFFSGGHYISRSRYKKRLKNLQAKYQLQLERERIARELHDNVGSQLTYLINKIEDDPISLSDQQEASKLSNFARGTMRELRETIWALNSKEVAPEDLENKIRQLARLHKGSNQSIDVDWHASNHHPPGINPIKALNIYRIIQEALNNAEKYSQASMVTVKVEHSENRLHVTVADNGKGFEPEQINEGYGLKNMRKRAQEMNSEFIVSSELQKGTIISVNIPYS